MKRKLRPILAQLSMLVLVIAGVWLSMPRDICLTKVLSGSCVCATDVTRTTCDCCSSSPTTAKSCCDKDKQIAAQANPHKSQSNQSTCFSVSSENVRLISPERIHLADFTFDNIAILPAIIDLTSEQEADTLYTEVPLSGINRERTYRENCVYLI